MDEDNVFFLKTAISGIIIILSIFVIADRICAYQCSNYEKITNKETKWMFLDSCYINTDNGWQRWEEYKMRAVTNE